MRKDLIFTEREAEFLRELVRQKVEFMLVGLSAATLQNAPVVTQDIDIWFKDLDSPGIRRALKKLGGVFVPSFNGNPPMLAGDAVQLFDVVVHMHGLGSFDEEKRHTILIPFGRVKIMVLGLDRIVRSKRALGREKDKLVLGVLEDVLAANNRKRNRT